MAATELWKSILKNSANLKAYYRFEETGGTSVADSSGNSMTGTASRTNILNNVGKFGNGATFVSASSDKITITDNAILKPTGNLTFGLWMKTSTTGATQVLFQSQSQNTALAGIRMWRLNSDNFIRFDVAKNTGTSLGTDYQTAVSTSSVTDGNWHLCVATYDGSNIRMYVDGKCEHTIAWAFYAVYAATNYVRFGCNNSTGTDALFYDGQIDDAFLINGTALSADQIKELYEGRTLGEGWPQSGLVGLWHLNGNSTDFSGNNYHGTDTAITYSLANGKFSQGASFNGSSSKISFGDVLDFERTSPFTYSAWFNTASTAGTLMAKQKDTANYDGIYLLWVGSVLRFGLTATDGTYLYGDAPSAYADSKWHYVVATYDGSTNTTGLHMYIDGGEVVLSTSKNLTATTTTNAYPFQIGARNGAYFYTGKIDEVQIYNVAKSADWVRKQYHEGLKKFYVPTV